MPVSGRVLPPPLACSCPLTESVPISIHSFGQRSISAALQLCGQQSRDLYSTSPNFTAFPCDPSELVFFSRVSMVFWFLSDCLFYFLNFFQMSSDMWSLLSSSPSPVPSHTSASSDDTAATSYSVAPKIIKPEPVKPVAVPDFSLSLAHLQAALCWQPQFLQNLLALYQLQQQQTLLQQLQVILENFTITNTFLSIH